MKLYAISDLHLGYEINRRAFETLPEHPDDWLIIGGDVGETEEQLAFTLRIATARFQRVFWVPGNHELWTMSKESNAPRGEVKYRRLIKICREYHVLTPEDPYVDWPEKGGDSVIAPLFLLYDYTFRPETESKEEAIASAMEVGLMCQDEFRLHPDPYPTREAWCLARCQWTEKRLAQIPREKNTILINHFPLRQDLAILPAIPRFSIWCGTKYTEDWHIRFRAKVVVSGHLHIRSTRWRDGVRFEEVSIGYPRHWSPDKGVGHYLREILPGPGSGSF